MGIIFDRCTISICLDCLLNFYVIGEFCEANLELFSGRRGLLLPTRLPEVVPIVLKALAFDEKRANLPVGAVIRDSACYVCWAFARAFDKDVLKPYINSIASSLVVVTVFDREV